MKCLTIKITQIEKTTDVIITDVVSIVVVVDRMALVIIVDVVDCTTILSGFIQLKRK